jgi:hypothetical protein
MAPTPLTLANPFGSPSAPSASGGLHKGSTLGTQLQEFFGLLIQAPPFGAIEDGPAQNADDDFRPEIVPAVEALHHLQHVAAIQPRIADVGQLVAELVGHRVFRDWSASHAAAMGSLPITRRLMRPALQD